MTTGMTRDRVSLNACEPTLSLAIPVAQLIAFFTFRSMINQTKSYSRFLINIKIPIIPRSLVELYEADPDIVFKTYGGRQETLLHRAALHRRIEMVQFLLEHGASQLEDVEGNTPLHCAALGGDAEVARALIAAGADLEIAIISMR